MDNEELVFLLIVVDLLIKTSVVKGGGVHLLFVGTNGRMALILPERQAKKIVRTFGKPFLKHIV